MIETQLIFSSQISHSKMDGWMDGWMDDWLDGWVMDRWTDGQLVIK